MIDEQFRLTNPPERKKYEPQPVEPTRQALLLVDMDDLPGQASLFQLNGHKETNDAQVTTATERTS